MTDEQPNDLDRARAKEAERQWVGCGFREPNAVVRAAMLARTGWKPADPVEGVVERICKQRGYRTDGTVAAMVREAVLAGIEIGKAKA